LKHFLSKLKHNLQDPELFELAAGTHGFVGADLSSLCHEAALATLRRYINWKQKSSNTSSTALSTSASIQLKNSNPDIMDSELSPLMRMEVNTMSWPSNEKEANMAGSTMGSLCTAFEGVQIDTTSVSHGLVVGEANGDCELKVTMQDFEVAKTRVRPSAMREVGFFTQ
jgi:SpoVK/Ycf46/Vps4 family AAA+-type ATPase